MEQTRKGEQELTCKERLRVESIPVSSIANRAIDLLQPRERSPEWRLCSKTTASGGLRDIPAESSFSALRSKGRRRVWVNVSFSDEEVYLQ